MAKIIDLKTFYEDSGNLTVIEKELPFRIQRIFYIYSVDNSTRGKHRHKKTRQFLLAVKGSCKVYNKASATDPLECFTLDSPSKALLVEPEDWHYMESFTADCILQVFASTTFDPDDYIYEAYPE